MNHSWKAPAIAELYLQRGVRRVSAAAYMKLSPYILRYALTGLTVNSHTGQIDRHNHVFAKISRPEVAAHFIDQLAKTMVDDLVRKGWITPEEAHLAQYVSVAEDVIVESDSGGHTDNQAISALFPVLCNSATRSFESIVHSPDSLGRCGWTG